MDGSGDIIWRENGFRYTTTWVSLYWCGPPKYSVEGHLLHKGKTEYLNNNCHRAFFMASNKIAHVSDVCENNP